MSNLETLACLLLPMGDAYWLIPSVVGAEVVPQPWLRSSQKEPVLSYPWREQDIPLINSEWLLGEASVKVDEPISRRICVLSSTQKAPKHPFWGIEMTGVPLFLSLKENEVLLSEESDLPVYAEAKVTLPFKRSAYVPKLNYLEELL